MRSRDVTDWAFTPSDEREAWQKGFDDTTWRSVVVPHDWSIEEDFSPEHSSGTGYLPGGTAWYRAHVSLAELGPIGDRHVRVVFHGVYKNADVWANGYHLGGRPSGYAEFSFDLTEVASYMPDDDLVLAVRVEHTDISDSRWYNGSGITRRVEVQVHEPVRIREHGTAVTTVSADLHEGSVRIEQTLVSDLVQDTRVRVQHELRSLTSDTVHTAATEIDIPGGGTAALDELLRVPSPELWSDTTPNLYRLTTTLVWSDDGVEARTAVDDVVGIRTIRFDPGRGFFINDEPRLLKGVCLHEDAGCLGTAVPAQVWLRRLLKLKEMGCNAVRMAHNPHAPELYALCDALGFFVIDEAFDEWENPKNKWWQGHNVYPPRHEGAAKDFPQWFERDLVAMIDAHRNHPSIVAWSIGNEIDYPNDPYASPLFDQMTGNNDKHKPKAERLYDPDRPDVRRLTTISNRLAAIVRRHDATRPVTIAAAFPELSIHTGLLETVDLIGYNYKEHLYAQGHQRFPDKPFVGSENSHSYDAWRHVTDTDFVAGQFLWTGIDYLGEAYGWPVRGSGAGLLTLAGFEKHTFHLRRSWWSDEPVAYLATRPIHDDDAEERSFRSHPVAREWGAGDGSPVEVLCFSNGDALTLTSGNEEIPLGRDEEHGYWTAVAVPGAAPLVLETSRAGEVVARDELVPAGPAVRIEATAWKPTPDASRRVAAVGLGDDGVAQIECTLLDERGNPAQGQALLTAHVVGGELLGLESGDLADNTPYRSTSRATHDGRVLVFVRCAERTVVELSAPGLASVTLELAAGPERSLPTRDGEVAMA